MSPSEFESELPAYLPILRALARRMVGNRDDAEDIVQEALLKATRSLDGFRADSSLKTWLFSITSRVAIDHLRAAKRWDKQVLVDACSDRGRESVTEKFGDPSVAFDVDEHLAFCFTCVGRSLEPEHQAALVLREIHQLENADAAEVLGMTEPKFRHTLAAARDTMRAEYEGLCALVTKGGACYQCRVLREMAPEGRRGADLPAFPLAFDERLVQLRSKRSVEREETSRMNDYFFGFVRAMQPARG